MAVDNREYDRFYIPITIKYKDPFDFATIYKNMLYWAQSNGYQAETGGEDNYEVLYRERQYPGSGELWLTWKMKKSYNKYIGHKMLLKIQILQKGKTEIMDEKTGKKKNMDTGELIINITGEITLNGKLDKEWDKDIFLRFPFNIIKRLFKIRTIKDTLDYWEDKSFPKHHSLAQMFKDQLGLKY